MDFTMAKITFLLLGIVFAGGTFSAELLEQNNGCDIQQKYESCVTNYCSLQSSISESPDCEQICDQCAKEACSGITTPTDTCKDINV